MLQPSGSKSVAFEYYFFQSIHLKQAKAMKTLLNFLTIWIIIGLYACVPKSNPVIEQPTQNADSIQCAQAWQSFQLPKDTILALHYQQPVKLVNGSDTMTITVVNIDDWCTEESLIDTDGCEARVKLRITLNNHCSYQNKYGLIVRPRSARPRFQNFASFECKHFSSNLIFDGPADSVLAFYNMLILLNQLTPFAKDLAEFNDLTANKQKYIATVWLKKRCF